MKFWYIIIYNAEDVGYSLVELTQIEADIVKRALEAPIIAGGGYCGSAYLYDKFFKTEEAARNEIIFLMYGGDEE
jgi:hypothetical protein